MKPATVELKALSPASGKHQAGSSPFETLQVVMQSSVEQAAKQRVTASQAEDLAHARAWTQELELDAMQF